MKNPRKRNPDYPRKKTDDFTPAENQSIRADIHAGKTTKEIVADAGNVFNQSQVAGVRSAVTKGL